MSSVISGPFADDAFDLEKARLKMDQLVDAAWNGAQQHASPGNLHELQGTGRDLAVTIFISGQIAGRPSMEALEQVIVEASQRLRGFPDESRGIAEAVMALLEDPKHERLMLLPRFPNDAEALWGYHRQREEEKTDGS
jgi:hypothetical protein